MCGGGWLPRVGELWIDGETWKAGHASSQPAHFQGPSSRGSSTALSPWSHFPLCPPSSSSPTLPPPWISDKRKLTKNYTEPILNLCCKINFCYIVINQQTFTLLRAVLVEGKIEEGKKGVFALTEEIILSRQQTNMLKIKH